MGAITPPRSSKKSILSMLPGDLVLRRDERHLPPLRGPPLEQAREANHAAGRDETHPREVHAAFDRDGLGGHGPLQAAQIQGSREGAGPGMRAVHKGDANPSRSTTSGRGQVLVVSDAQALSESRFEVCCAH